MDEQNTLGFSVEKKLDTVEEYKFEPIKGYPMLNWKGKRPFTHTQFYPAQLKENHGEPVDGWMNRIYWGDNLQVMSHLLKELRGKVVLVCIDPPFDSKADYKKKINRKNIELSNDSSVFEEKQYTDIWTNDEYLQFMYERLILIRELMADNASIYLHCDTNKSHQLRCILDEIFGSSNFINEIIREKSNPKNYTRNQFGNIHDTIFVYCKNITAQIWNKQYTLRNEKTIENDFPKIEEKSNRRYKTRPIHAPGLRNGKTGGTWKGMLPPPGKHWQYLPSKLDEFDEKGLIEWSENGNPRLKVYADESMGVFIQDIWMGLKDTPKYNYPTEKNENLLERIINASSNPNDIVFDCFMGSGTTQAAAMKLGRRFIGADINLGAIQTTTKRLINTARDLNSQIQEETKYTGFSVYNVNHYDVFRNPLEAKELLIKALEIQPMPNSNLYDGEKDGRMVKIMPVNRIATRADLNELITNFDYKTFEKTNEKNPGKPVAHILLVCMGHEPDLAAELQKAVPYKLDIEVVDILRDKSNLEFKRESEAEVSIEGGKLIIREFYPMNLLQKLSMQKEAVENWKELTESVMVDFNYDGAVFEPTVVDVPEGAALVKGIYNVPANAGTIRVKITDLLSESLEITVNNG